MEPVCPSQSAAWNKHKGDSPQGQRLFTHAATLPTTNSISNPRNRTLYQYFATMSTQPGQTDTVTLPAHPAVGNTTTTSQRFPPSSALRYVSPTRDPPRFPFRVRQQLYATLGLIVNGVYLSCMSPLTLNATLRETCFIQLIFVPVSHHFRHLSRKADHTHSAAS